MKEYRKIKSLKFLYEITSDGKIRNVKSKKELKTNINNCGYERVNLNKLGTPFIHRLIAEAWIKNPLNLPNINHKSGIKTENCVENLEWCTKSFNSKHAYTNNLMVNFKQYNLEKSKAIICLNNDMIFDSIWEASEWLYDTLQTTRYNPKQTTVRGMISAVCNGKRKNCWKYKFKFI